MSQIKFSSICLLTGLLLFSQIVFGQQETIREPDMNKPTRFSQFPDSTNCRTGNLFSLFTKTGGDNVSAVLADGLLFEGKLISKKVHTDSSTSLVLKSANYSGFTLSLFLKRNPDGSSVVSGRLLSFVHGDAFVLMYSHGGYIWIRKKLNDLVNE